MSKNIYRCAQCKGTNVQHAMWVQLNSNQVLDEFGTWCAGDNSWCDDCHDHAELEDVGEDHRVFVALNDTFICEDCLPAELRARLGDEDVQVWEEESDGWTGAVICRQCHRSIPVFVNGLLASESEALAEA